MTVSSYYTAAESRPAETAAAETADNVRKEKVMNIQSLISAIRSNGKSTNSLTRKGIELSFVYATEGRDLSADKTDMKAAKTAYESANNGLRWASSPLYKAIKTACKRVAAGDFVLVANESAEQAAARYIADMAAAGASLQNCLTFDEMAEKAAERAEKARAAAETAEQAAAESVFTTLAATLAAAESAEQAAADMLAADEETAAALAAALAKAIKAAAKAKAAA